MLNTFNSTNQFTVWPSAVKYTKVSTKEVNIALIWEKKADHQ